MLADTEHVSRDELLSQLSLVLEDRAISATLPTACYTDHALLQYEINTLFRQSWVGVGRTDRCTKPGDFSSRDIGGVPVLLIRNQGGELKAFANTCRHRGSLLLKGDGNCKKIRCPFHCWTYDLDGRLVFTPRMEAVPDFDLTAYGLTEFGVGVADGFAFVSLDAAAGEFDKWLGDYSSLHAAWGLSQWVTTRVREFEVNCNWKIFLEVFNEYYHLPYVHPKSINRMYPEPDDADQTTGNYTTQFGTTKGNAALLSDVQGQAFSHAVNLTGRERNGTRYTWVYPNMTFAASSDSLWMYEAYPITPHRSLIVQTVCFPAETVVLEDFESRAKHYYDRIDTAITEDIPFLEQQQTGLSSPFAKQGRFSRLEPSVANFAYWYASRLSGFLG
ncbi:MAG: aromatic ring-hydroxylating dioxygenase subunit alpha [Arenicellales bacterium]|nr:aromatic ring-hydroxylating dioxygenase subunit alpha [Arenicellales bacterium]